MKKKIVTLILATALTASALTACGSSTASSSSSSSSSSSTASSSISETETPTPTEEATPTPTEEATSTQSESEDSSVPWDYTSALNSAESYSEIMHMSKAGIYDQLTSEYGDQFSAEAAQYAVDNMTADWNANALATAENYNETMHMSKAGLYDQLTSENFSELDSLQKDLANMRRESSLHSRMQTEINKMKKGSIALVGQITTISKIRIYDPKTNYDILSNVKLSNEMLDRIDNEIIKKFTGLKKI